MKMVKNIWINVKKITLGDMEPNLTKSAGKREFLDIFLSK